jgi:hypothetical protein
MNLWKKRYKNMNLDLYLGCGKENVLRIILIINLSCPQIWGELKLIPKVSPQ